MIKRGNIYKYEKVTESFGTDPIYSPPKNYYNKIANIATIIVLSIILAIFMNAAIYFIK